MIEPLTMPANRFQATRPAEQEQGEDALTAAAHLRGDAAEEHAEDQRVDAERGRRVDQGPQPAEDAALVAGLQIPLRQVGDQVAVRPDLGRGGQRRGFLGGGKRAGTTVAAGSGVPQHARRAARVPVSRRRVDLQPEQPERRHGPGGLGRGRRSRRVAGTKVSATVALAHAGRSSPASRRPRRPVVDGLPVRTDQVEGRSPGPGAWRRSRERSAVSRPSPGRRPGRRTSCGASAGCVSDS